MIIHETRTIGTSMVTASVWTPVNSYISEYSSLMTIDGRLCGKVGVRESERDMAYHALHLAGYDMTHFSMGETWFVRHD